MEDFSLTIENEELFNSQMSENTTEGKTNEEVQETTTDYSQLITDCNNNFVLGVSALLICFGFIAGAISGGVFRDIFRL